ncbi:MAG: deoxyribose-phosphate aldolase [Mycoplasma sp.]|nr:deoxyribose-phosphate aldolase [Mycoplasma sp.]
MKKITTYNKFIDHTSLKPQTTKKEIKILCNEAKKFKFASVCVNPCFVEFAAKELKDTKVKVCTVIGFPLGANTTETKVFETKDAIKKGAQEIDMVINVGKLKENDYKYLTNEIAAVKKACGKKILKVIIETCLLSDKEKVEICKCIKNAKADFVKTSTGFSTGGACLEDIKLLKKTVKNSLLIKASGGIKTKDEMLKMIKAGANRIGTSKGTSLIK